MQRSAGHVRHLSCRVLWIQSHMKQRLLSVAKIPTKDNCSDLCTEKLSKDSFFCLMKMLGIFETETHELVGSNVVARIRHHEDFALALRLLQDILGEPAIHSGNMTAKKLCNAWFWPQWSVARLAAIRTLGRAQRRRSITSQMRRFSLVLAAVCFLDCISYSWFCKFGNRHFSEQPVPEAEVCASQDTPGDYVFRWTCIHST